MIFTVLGSTGYIGIHLVRYLESLGHEVKTPDRSARSLEKYGKLGHVIYAIGLTGDFRQHPEATIEAHVSILQQLIHKADFDSWLYLSSTRIYNKLPATTAAREETSLVVSPGLDDIYNLSKLLGESLCLAGNDPDIRIARLSNVYGPGQSSNSFLGSIINDLKKTGSVTIGESPESSKDYISIDDILRLLTDISTKGKHQIYNVASGHSVSHEQIAKTLRNMGYSVTFAQNAPTRRFPDINTERLQHEFDPASASLLEALPYLLRNTL